MIYERPAAEAVREGEKRDAMTLTPDRAITVLIRPVEELELPDDTALVADHLRRA